MTARLSLSLLVISILSCQRDADPGIEMIESHGTMIPKINIEQIEKEKKDGFKKTWVDECFQDITLP